VVAAAGDIACHPSEPGWSNGLGTATNCRQKWTADLLEAAGPAGVLPLGDLQYQSADLDGFQRGYGASWGGANDRAYPVPGNRDYLVSGATGYFDYFNGPGVDAGRAGRRSEGYYSYDLGSWHLIALNSNCAEVACNTGSAQDAWLRQDLAAHRNTCTLAYWHHPRVTTVVPTDSSMDQIFQDLYDADADLVLTGHAHAYERFAAMNPQNGTDAARGIRQFVVGTGGHSHHQTRSGSSVTPEIRNDDTFGVLQLTLNGTGYEWRFVPQAGGQFRDSGSQACH
jgi:hypothetical protein